MKRISWPGVGLVAVLGAAFCVQATSTWRYGVGHNLADLARPALVVLLEVGSITTASIFFSARSRGLRVRALLLLAVCAGTGGMGGVIAYGWVVGLVVAVLMLGLVEVVGTYRREQRSTVDQESTVVDHEPVDPWVTIPKPVDSVPPLVDEEAAARFAGLREASRVEWPSPHVEPPVTLHVAGFVGPTVGDLVSSETTKIENGAISSGWIGDVVPFRDPTPTEPLPRSVRLDESVPVDVHDATVDREAWREHMPTEAEYAAVILDHLPRDGRRLSEAGLHEALLVVCPETKKYRAKKYLGNVTTRHRAAGEEATG